MLLVFHCKDKRAYRQHKVPLIIDSRSLSLRVGVSLGCPLQLPGSLILTYPLWMIGFFLPSPGSWFIRSAIRGRLEEMVLAILSAFPRDRGPGDTARRLSTLRRVSLSSGFQAFHLFLLLEGPMWRSQEIHRKISKEQGIF